VSILTDHRPGRFMVLRENPRKFAAGVCGLMLLGTPCGVTGKKRKGRHAKLRR
jgi:hypothetical protein